MYKRDKKLLESIPEAARDWPVGMVCNHSEYGKCAYIGPVTIFGDPTGNAGIVIETPEDGKGYRPAVYSDLTPVEAWSPKPNEVVAKWNHAWHEFAPVVFQEHGNDWGTGYACIARVPEGFTLTRETLTVKWWQEHGEIYEAES